MEGVLSQEVITGLCVDRRELSGREEYEGWHLSMGQCWRKQAWKLKNCFTPRTGIPHWSTSQVRRRGREGYEGVKGWLLYVGRCLREQASKANNCFTPRTGIPHWSTLQVRRSGRQGGVRGGGCCLWTNVKENMHKKQRCKSSASLDRLHGIRHWSINQSWWYLSLIFSTSAERRNFC